MIVVVFVCFGLAFIFLLKAPSFFFLSLGLVFGLRFEKRV